MIIFHYSVRLYKIVFQFSWNVIFFIIIINLFSYSNNFNTSSSTNTSSIHSTKKDWWDSIHYKSRSLKLHCEQKKVFQTDFLKNGYKLLSNIDLHDFLSKFLIFSFSTSINLFTQLMLILYLL